MADWRTQAAAELARFTGRHAAKQRATVVALVDAHLAGTPEEEVWRRPETCSRTVYHTKWKKDATFADVLETVETLARDWKANETVRELAEAARRLALASPVAVTKVIEVISTGHIEFRDRYGNVIRTENASMTDVLRAAFGILDRAGIETAVKGSSEVTGVELSLDEWKRQQAERRQQAAEALADVDIDDGDTG